MSGERAAQYPNESKNELQELMRISESENRYYEALQRKYNIFVEQCRNCWKIGKHTTQLCLQTKPVCPRCGSDEQHAREECFVMCFRCGEVGAQAFHESCPRRRAEIMKQALMKRYGLDAGTARDVARGKLPIPDAAQNGSSGSNT